MHKRVSRQQTGFISYASVALQTIRDNCRKNQRQDNCQVTYKPLLLESSQNFRKNNLMKRNSQIRSQPKTCVTVFNFNQSYDSRFAANNQNRPRSVKSFQHSRLSQQSWNIFKPRKIFISRQTATQFTNQTCFTLKQDNLILFLRKLYFAKTQDLKIHPNKKQQKIFIRRLLNSVNQKQFITSQCDFGKNSIEVIIKYLSENIQIKKLILDKNPIGDQSAIKIANLIPSLKLKQLSLVSINITNKSACILLKAIEGHQTLQKFNLSSPQGLNRNRISPQAFAQFKQIMQNPLCKINNLNLSNTGMRQIGFLAFCAGFQKKVNVKFKYINLSSNQIVVTAQNQKYIRSCLANLSVEKLQMQNNQIGDQGLKTFAHLLGTHFGANQISLNLTYLDISNNNIKSYGFQLFCNTLSANKKLSQLYLNQNDLAVNEIFYCVRQLLTHSWVIKRLHMKNTLPTPDPLTTSHQLKALSEGLSLNKSLRQLNISNINIDVGGFAAIIESLKQNKILLVLQMECCGIGDAHLIKAQKLLKQNRGLKQINMSNNCINDNGARILQKILASAHNIINLNIKKNCIGLHILNDIEYQLKQNRAMKFNQQDPQQIYVNYANSMQQQQKKIILSTINQLTSKAKHINARSVALGVVQKQQQIAKKENQIKIESNKIIKLEEQISNQVKLKYKLKNNIHKQKQLEIDHSNFLVTD